MFEEYKKSYNDIVEVATLAINKAGLKNESVIKSEEARKLYELMEKTTMDYRKVQNQCIEDMNRYSSYVIGCSKPYIITT